MVAPLLWPGAPRVVATRSSRRGGQKFANGIANVLKLSYDPEKSHISLICLAELQRPHHDINGYSDFVQGNHHKSTLLQLSELGQCSRV